MKPTTPEAEAGIRIEPPMSEPVASAASPAASAAPEPPEEPPGVKARFHGLRVTPHCREWQKGAQENSGVVVRAWITAPASTSRCTTGALFAATWSAYSSEP